MNPFIIVIDKPLEESEVVFVTRLESLGYYLKLTSTCYLLRTNSNAVDIREALKEVDDEIGLFVSALTTPAAWRNLEVDNDKLKSMYHE